MIGFFRNVTTMLVCTLPVIGIFSTPVLGQDIKKSDVLNAVRTHGQMLGSYDYCLAWVAGSLPRPSLSNEIRDTMFDADISGSDIEYYNSEYASNYEALIEQGKLQAISDNGALCAQIGASKENLNYMMDQGVQSEKNIVSMINSLGGS